MHISDMRFRTGQAALIAGWNGAEGLRTQLKAGLLKGTGVPDQAEAKLGSIERDAKRWAWSEFTFTDVCAFRLAKSLIDAGVDVSLSRQIASTDDIWAYQLSAQLIEEKRAKGGIPEIYVVIGGPNTKSESKWQLAEKDQISHIVSGNRALSSLVYFVVSLKDVRRDVNLRISRQNVEL